MRSEITMKKAYITTLGCKVNQFESASIQSSLASQGYATTGRIDNADIIIINTCAVTSKASAQSRQTIRRAARNNKDALIVVTGCHAQMAAEEIRSIADIAADRLRIIGNDRKDRIVPDVLQSTLSHDLITENLWQNARDICDLPVDRFWGRTRAFLKIQDGCNSFCSYCIVPSTRGPSRSLKRAAVIKQARQFQAAGHQEIVITGIHVGQYGKDLTGEETISSLMEQLCSELPEIRFRLSSIEPLEISPHLIELITEYDNFMSHLHIPLQSGNNEILKRMNRRYTGEQFREKLQFCRSRIPDAAIGIDVLVGFPGESREQFNSTVSLLESIDFTYLHVFPYSQRPGTVAAAFPDQLDNQEKSDRVETLRILSEKNRFAFYTRLLGSRRNVLIEKERDESGLLKGFTENYIPVVVDAGDRFKNQIVRVELTSIEDDAVRAQLIEHQ